MPSNDSSSGALTAPPLTDDEVHYRKVEEVIKLLRLNGTQLNNHAKTVEVIAGRYDLDETGHLKGRHEGSTVESTLQGFFSDHPFAIQKGSTSVRPELVHDGHKLPDSEWSTYFGAKSDSRKATQLYRENPNEYRRLRRIYEVETSGYRRR